MDVNMQNENAEYLSEQLITYLGNKRRLLNFIGEAIDSVKKKLNKEKLRIFDVFSGSGIVSRYLKQSASYLAANDLELYSYLINTCYLSNSGARDMVQLRGFFCDLKEKLDECEFTGEWKRGVISELYAPKDDSNIKKGERVFYTKRNASYIDTARSFIDSYPERLRAFFIAPLLAAASVHANTGGVFKGFYKNRETGIGEFGGKNRDALSRITGDIDLEFPVFSTYDCDVDIYRRDANELIFSLEEVDLAYLDPPYNQHPYGSNYFMLNVIAENKMPRNPSSVSGIPSDWNRSVYNTAKEAPKALAELIENVRAKYVLLSFNSEGFTTKDELTRMMSRMGKLNVFEAPYNAFRASRNLKNRNAHVTEYLFLLEK